MRGWRSESLYTDVEYHDSDDDDNNNIVELQVTILSNDEFKCICCVLTRLGFTVAMRGDNTRVFYVLWDCQEELARPDIDTVNPFNGLSDITSIIRRDSVQSM